MKVFTVIETKQTHIGSTKAPPVIVTQTLYILADVVGEAIGKWKTLNYSRDRLSKAQEAFITTTPDDTDIIIPGLASETITLEQYECWKQTMVSDSRIDGELVKASWLKIK